LPVRPPPLAAAAALGGLVGAAGMTMEKTDPTSENSFSSGPGRRQACMLKWSPR
jgi:hypothetical protein